MSLLSAQRERTTRRKFGDLVNAVFAVKPGVFGLIADDTLVCRCEEVTAGEIRAAVAAWGAQRARQRRHALRHGLLPGPHLRQPARGIDGARRGLRAKMSVA